MTTAEEVLRPTAAGLAPLAQAAQRRRAQPVPQPDFRVEDASDTVVSVGPCVLQPHERRIVLEHPGAQE